MSKERSTWHSPRLGREVTVVRWGATGTPVLFFPTAAADAEECERFHMTAALSDLLAGGRVKLYSVDSVPGQVWLTENNSTGHGAWIQNLYDAFVYHELVPAIRADCRDDSVGIVVTGPSIGAFNALAALCRHPDVFSKAICMSGTYDLKRFLEGEPTSGYFECSPLHFVPHIPQGPHLDALRRRFVLITHGEGRWEEPEESWRMADVLGSQGIPNRVDPWDRSWDHDWPTWREMLPRYLEEMA